MSKFVYDLTEKEEIELVKNHAFPFLASGHTKEGISLQPVFIKATTIIEKLGERRYLWSHPFLFGMGVVDTWFLKYETYKFGEYMEEAMKETTLYKYCCEKN